MISVEEALARITGAFSPVAAETVSLAAAFGRVTAEPVLARVTQPPVSVSAMDGYAVRAADVARPPAVLDVLGEAAAGSPPGGPLQAGQAMRIFTGGPMPKGADAVVIQENTKAEAGRVTVLEGVAPGTFVRRAGLDFERGAEGIPAARRLSARDVGLAAAMNVPWLQVRRRPRIAVLATGDEIVMPGEALSDSRISSSNGLALAAFVQARGGEAINLGIAQDTAESLSRMAAGARGADLLVTTGGASVGDRDLVHAVLGAEGRNIDFWRIAMRPGKPLMFGRLGDTPILGLPGNPVSSLVCAAIFLGPALDRMVGLAGGGVQPSEARLEAPLGANDRRQDYLRATLRRDGDGTLLAQPFAKQDSSMLATLAHADGLIVRPPHAPAAGAGDPVPVLPMAVPGLGI
jgi:molybdopterin molybdotransferase